MTFDRGETDVMHFPFFVMLAIVNLSDSQSFEIIFCQNA